MSLEHTYYATPGPMTDPGPHAAALDELPTGVADLCRVVQGVMIHIFWADQYGVQLSAERQAEVQLRRVDRQIEQILALDPRSLAEARPPQRRLAGNCRDFSVLLTTILRHQGVPARARCGFGRYFMPGHYEDHWVAEVWDGLEQRWRLVDAQLDALQQAKLNLAFDPLDVPRDQFIVGGKAWRLCRQGEADPDTFGIADMHGLWFVRGDFVRDVAALNKMELLPWDSWGLCEEPPGGLSADQMAMLDHVADLTAVDAPDFDILRAVYEGKAGFRVPSVITSYTPAGPQAVDLTHCQASLA